MSCPSLTVQFAPDYSAVAGESSSSQIIPVASIAYTSARTSSIFPFQYKFRMHRLTILNVLPTVTAPAVDASSFSSSRILPHYHDHPSALPQEPPVLQAFPNSSINSPQSDRYYTRVLRNASSFLTVLSSGYNSRYSCAFASSLKIQFLLIDYDLIKQQTLHILRSCHMDSAFYIRKALS